MPFTFVANLKPYTFHRGRGIRRFDAYLLSADFSGGGLVELAKKVVRDDAKLCADNGNVDAIRGLIQAFEAQAMELDARRKNEEARLGGYARPGELSARLTGDYQRLSERIRAASFDATPDTYVSRAVGKQEAMKATYAIGMEDLTIATMTGLSVEPEYVSLDPSFYSARNARAVDFALRTQRGAFGPPPRRVFAGVHALDFDQAVEAGRLVGEAGLHGIATGLVGALRDRNSIDFRMEAGAVVELGETTARPYLRVLEVATGLHLGFHAATGRRPDFHALGAGTPILFPLLGLLTDDTAYTSTDSTAPIVDGWSGATISLYVDDPAPLKLRPEKIAQSWLEGNRGWDCDCAYCTGFAEEHPPNLSGATRWWNAEGKPRLSKYHLGRRGGLVEYLPFLGHHPHTEIRTAAGLARVGHNHSILQRIERVVRESVASGEVTALHAMVDAYLSFPGVARWQASARHAREVAAEGRRRLDSRPRAQRRESPTVLQSRVMADALGLDLVNLLHDGIESLRSDVRRADWDACDVHATTALGVGRACLVRVLADRNRTTQTQRALQSQHARMRSAIAHLARTQPGFFGSVSEALQERADVFADSLGTLRTGSTRGVGLLDTLQRLAPPSLRDDAELAIASTTQGLLARVHASFNSPTSRRTAGSSSLAVQEGALAQALEQLQRELFTSVGRGEDLSKARTAALALSAFVEAELPAFVEAQRAARDEFDALIRDGKGGEAERLGVHLAESGLLTRKAIALHAAGQNLALESVLGIPSEEGQRLLHAADTMTFGFRLGHGKDTPLHSVPDAEDGELVEVWGRVVGAEALRVGDKLISRVELQSTTNESRVTVTVRFAHLPHAGLTVGAFVRANGVVNHASTVNDGNLAIEATQLPLAELAEQSWALGLVYSGRKWMAPWRTSANLWWSLGFHEPVGSRFGAPMGAGELLFTNPQR